ncbi:MAG: CaiB/BaiF CoA transferase family protein [Actinomycetota bacterium]|nr:CoA transferase [Acidimicrobiales bacterium]
MLSNYRVLDLSDERGQLAGLILADLGAEVILVEPLGGSRSRKLGPFVDQRDGDPEASLWFWSYNRGKRSISLDLSDSNSNTRIHELAKTADVIIESSDVGVMKALNLDYEALAAVNPELIYVSISAFGQSGPKAKWVATDITVASAAMQMSMQGDEDRAPLRIPLDQTFLHASADAATAALIALHDRSRSGKGQHVDISAQQSYLAATQSFCLAHLYNASEGTRASGALRVGPFNVRLRSPAADGYVSVTILFGEAIGPFSQRLFEWILEEGECDAADAEIDWVNFVENIMTGVIDLGEYDRIQEVAANFTAKRTKKELLDEALKRRLLIVPVANVADVSHEDHYLKRDFWREIEVPGHGLAVFPGPHAKLTKTPLDISSPPPSIGEANDEIFEKMPSQPELPSIASSGTENLLPLSDLKILDFQWVMAGPASTRIMADWGAQVIRVESSNKVETARTIQPFLNDEGGADNSGLYQNMNAGKTGLTIDMSKPEARDVIIDLVKWADVVCESFSPKAMQSWGLSYSDLIEINPQIIMTSSCLFGQDGPLSSLAGFGTMGAAMSGFYEMTGWPDRPPAGVMGAYTDYVSPRYLATTILAAIDHRNRTGEGQYIDLSQAESSMHFLAPAVLDYKINGKLAPQIGNAHPVLCPHGAYPSLGDDKWVTIACQDDESYVKLCEVAGLNEDLKVLELASRRERASEIDEAIANWTMTLSSKEISEILQDCGVAAHAVQVASDLVEDPQLLHRKHFREVTHQTNEKMWVEGTRFQMSRSRDEITDGGPSYGQHTFDVLEGILGYEPAQIADLAVAGVLE